MTTTKELDHVIHWANVLKKRFMKLCRLAQLYYLSRASTELSRVSDHFQLCEE